MLPGPGVCVMKLWMRERDQLIERTMAFVQGVAAAKPARAVAVDPARVEPAKPVTQAELPTAELPRPAGVIAMGLAPMASERAEIERRVAKFKAQQQKFQRAREDHYDAIFSKARATPGNQTRP
jgi:chorismate mutase